MSALDDDSRWLARTIDLAIENVANGGGPFGALIVRDGELVAEGQNRVTANLDPTAHAEVVAIRAACQAVGDFSLAGATLYTSCEPCPLCLSASLWASVDRVVYAADRHDAARGRFRRPRVLRAVRPRPVDLGPARRGGAPEQRAGAVRGVVGTRPPHRLLSRRARGCRPDSCPVPTCRVVSRS